MNGVGQGQHNLKSKKQKQMTGGGDCPKHKKGQELSVPGDRRGGEGRKTSQWLFSFRLYEGKGGGWIRGRGGYFHFSCANSWGGVVKGETRHARRWSVKRGGHLANERRSDKSHGKLPKRTVESTGQRSRGGQRGGCVEGREDQNWQKTSKLQSVGAVMQKQVKHK